MRLLYSLLYIAYYIVILLICSTLQEHRHIQAWYAVHLTFQVPKVQRLVFIQEGKGLTAFFVDDIIYKE